MLSQIKLSAAFDVASALQDDRINFEPASMDAQGAIPFIGRSSSNNGVVGYVEPRENLTNEGGCLTVALDGSTGSTFYQAHDFASGQNIWILRPGPRFGGEFDSMVALYCVTSIRKAVRNYGYNLSLTKARLTEVKLWLPMDGDALDTDHMRNAIEALRSVDEIRQIPTKRCTA